MDGEEDRTREELKKCEQCSGNMHHVLASYPGLLRRRDKAWYLLFAHARVAVEFHRRRLSSYTFAVRDEYSSVFLAVREALLFAIYSVASDDCIVSSFLEALAQQQKYNLTIGCSW